MAAEPITRHAPDCRMAFGRLDPNCPRCKELAAGAEPRQWHGTARLRADLQRMEDIRKHNCKTAGCGPVCTFGDW